MTTQLQRFLNNVNTLARAVDRATRGKRRFRLNREHIETAVGIGGTILSLFGGKYVAAAKAAQIAKQLQEHLTDKKKSHDSDRKRNLKTSRSGHDSNKPIPIRPAQSE